MTDINLAWGDSFGPPKVTKSVMPAMMPAIHPMPPMPPTMPPDQHPSVHHPPQMLKMARIEEPYQQLPPPGPTRTEIYIQDSMASLHRQMEGVREELRRRDDKDERFSKLERLIKKVALGLLAAIIGFLVIVWLRLDKHVKTLSTFIQRLAVSRLELKQVIDAM